MVLYCPKDLTEGMALSDHTCVHVLGILHSVDYDKLAADYFQLRPGQQHQQKQTLQGNMSISSVISGLGAAIKERVHKFNLAAFLDDHSAGEGQRSVHQFLLRFLPVLYDVRIRKQTSASTRQMPDGVHP